MIKNQFFTLFFTLALLTMSCKNEQKETAAALHMEIMVEHDKVMPKMAEINRLKRQLMVYKNIVADENFTLKDSVLNSILVLSKSEDLMTDWMGKYRYPDPNRSPEDMIKYLTAQKDTITEVGNNIFMSLSIGNSLLKNAPDSIKMTKPKAAEMPTNH